MLSLAIRQVLSVGQGGPSHAFQLLRPFQEELLLSDLARLLEVEVRVVQFLNRFLPRFSVRLKLHLPSQGHKGGV